MYGEPETELVVPVGEDQVSHVELAPRNRPAIQLLHLRSNDKTKIVRARECMDASALCRNIHFQAIFNDQRTIARVDRER